MTVAQPQSRNGAGEETRTQVSLSTTQLGMADTLTVMEDDPKPRSSRVTPRRYGGLGKSRAAAPGVPAKEFIQGHDVSPFRYTP